MNHTNRNIPQSNAPNQPAIKEGSTLNTVDPYLTDSEPDLSPVNASQPVNKLSKHELSAYFDHQISDLCFIPEDTPGEYMIKGKYCLIINHYDPDLWDILICNPDDMGKGLSTRKVKNVVNVIDWRDGKYRMMTGEADGIVVGKKTILENMKALGLRKKRTMSPEQRAKNTVILAKHRRGKQ